MYSDLTTGSITRTMLRLISPMIIGNPLQQFYNIADTLVVGRYLGIQVLAAVRAAYALMLFFTPTPLGLYMGSGAMFFLCYDEKNEGVLKSSMLVPFVLVAAVAPVLNTAVFLFIDPVIYPLCVPMEIYGFMREYLWVIFFGISAVFLYNYFVCLLRVVGNSFIPLVFPGASALLSMGLGLVFVPAFKWGVAGTGAATVAPQFVSGIGVCLYAYLKMSEFRINRSYMKMDREVLAETSGFSFLTCVQQSVMNFGTLMVQGLVDSFGAVAMTVFAAAVKIDSLAYTPVRDFGNASSIFTAQSYGVGRYDRVEKGIKSVVTASILFYLVISFIVCVFVRELMLVFVQSQEAEILAMGVQYLRIEGTFCCGIGCLFLLYGLCRVMRKPEMSVVLTIISLGTRVVLIYVLSAILDIGVVGIWISVPTGWFLADCTEFAYYWMKCRAILEQGGN